MVHLFSIFALAAAFAGQVLAKDSTKCYTAMTDKKPGRYPPTSWTTHYAPCTTTKVSTVVTTVYPSQTTTSSRGLFITRTITDTEKKTVTVLKTSTIKRSTVTTTTSTKTGSTTIDATKSLTVPAPSMFTPIQSSVPNSSNGPISGGAAGKRSTDSLEKRASSKNCIYGKGKGKTYPKMVMCHKYTDKKPCVTKKVTKTSTVTASATATPSFTFTVNLPGPFITRTTVYPNGMTTVTSTTTVTETSTSTAQTVTTTISTKTNFVGTSTINAACLSSANFANQASGSPLVEINGSSQDPTFRIVQVRTDSAFSCCNAAFAGTSEVPAAQIFAFDRRIDPADPAGKRIISVCTIFGAQTCGRNQAANKFEILNEEQSDDGEGGVGMNDIVELPTFGNAACGLGVGPQ